MQIFLFFILSLIFWSSILASVFHLKHHFFCSVKILFEIYSILSRISFNSHRRITISISCHFFTLFVCLFVVKSLIKMQSTVRAMNSYNRDLFGHSYWFQSLLFFLLLNLFNWPVHLRFLQTTRIIEIGGDINTGHVESFVFFFPFDKCHSNELFWHNSISSIKFHYVLMY